MIANLKNSMKKRLKVQRNADAKECRCKVYPYRFKRIKLSTCQTVICNDYQLEPRTINQTLWTVPKLYIPRTIII